MKIRGKMAGVLSVVLLCTVVLAGCATNGDETPSTPTTPTPETPAECISSLAQTTWVLTDGETSDPNTGKMVTGDLAAEAMGQITFQFNEDGTVLMTQVGADDQTGTYAFHDCVVSVTFDEVTTMGTVNGTTITFITENDTQIFTQQLES